MDAQSIQKTVIQALSEIAPEVDLEKIRPDIPFREQFDFDSVNFLTFIEKLQKLLTIEISPVDAPRLASLEGCIGYLSEK